MSNKKAQEAKKRVLIQQELARIYKKNKGLRASDVVEEATPEESPLHDSFQWDESKAAHSYRLIQARNLIRVIRIDVVQKDGGIVAERMINVPSIQVERDENKTDEGAYYPASVVVADESMYIRALTALTVRLKAAEAAVDDLKEAASTLPYDAERSLKLQLAINAIVAANSAVAALN